MNFYKKAHPLSWLDLTRAVAFFLVTSLLIACDGGTPYPTPNSVYQVAIESVPVIIAPRIASSQDGTVWLVWPEGESMSESLAAASVSSSGELNRSQIAPVIEGAQRDVQIIVAGSTPIVVWREYSPSGVRVRVSAHVAGAWRSEFVADASLAGGLQLIQLPNDTASLVWQRDDVMGGSQFVSAQRSAAGVWSPAVVIASTASGVVLGIPRHATAGDQSLAIVWTEELTAVSTTLEPQTLKMSQYDPGTNTWGSVMTVDDTNGRYYSYDIACSGPDNWVVVWASGSPDRRSSILSKRLTGSVWDAAPTGVDLGDDYTIREVTLLGRESAIYLAWTGLAEFLSPNSLRVSKFDSGSRSWSPPSMIDSTSQGYPELPRLAINSSGAAVLVWNVSQGIVGGPFIASTNRAGVWQPPSLLDSTGSGRAADISLLLEGDLAAVWYRYPPRGPIDIVVRRMSLL